MKYVSIDIETTGLDPLSHDIVEFGAVLDDLSDPKPLKDRPRFHAYISEKEYVGQPYALSMHPDIFRRIATREKGYNYISPQKLGVKFKGFLLEHGYEVKYNKITINAAGKNLAGFDNLFLKNKTDWASHINVRARILDPAILYYEDGDEKLPDSKLCMERAGLKGVVAHTAIEDAIMVIKLLRAKLC